MRRVPTATKHCSDERKTFVRPSDQVADQRMHAAAMRAIESSQRLRNKAEALAEELEDVTPAHGIITTCLSEEDSMVTSVAALLESKSHAHK
jgi:hypothetical protein